MEQPDDIAQGTPGELTCPGCGRTVQFSSEAPRAICTYPDCPRTFHFALFDDLESAETFSKIRGGWAYRQIIETSSGRKFALAYAHEPARPYHLTTLTALVDETILASIQAGFADNMGGSIVLAETTHPGEHRRIDPLRRHRDSSTDAGKYPSEQSMRNYIKYCEVLRLHRSSTGVAGNQLCLEYEENFINQVLASGRATPVWDYCWSGFVQYCAPIVVTGHVLGAIFSGQRRYKGDKHTPGVLLSFRQTDKENYTPPHFAECVRAACNKLGLDSEYMLTLAQADQAKVVDDTDIQEELARLVQLARYIESLAETRYCAERTVREQEFLDRVWSIFVEAIAMIDEKESTVWSVLGCVLREVQRFISNTVAVFFILENQGRMFSPKAGDLSILKEERRQQLPVPHCLLDLAVLEREDLHVVSLSTRTKPAPTEAQLRAARDMFLRQDVVTCGFLPVSLSNHHRGVLMLVKVRDDDDSLWGDSTCRQAAKFFAGLGRTLSQGLNLALAMSKTKREELQREKEMISIAHEIDLPLQSMLADAFNLSREIPLEPEPKEIATRLLSETQLIQLRAQTLLKTSPAVGGEERHLFKYHAVYRPLKVACDMFRSEADHKGCQIRGPKSLGGDFPNIEISLDALTLAFKNLIANAVKYSFWSLPETVREEERRGRERFINVIGYFQQGRDDEYVIEVSNYGVGITEEEIALGLIFQRGYRGKLATDRHRTGSGLGLPYVKHVVTEIHNGRLEVVSKPMGGEAYLTTMRVILPIRNPDRKEK